jgi:hypothetical protein
VVVTTQKLFEMKSGRGRKKEKRESEGVEERTKAMRRYKRGG